MATQHRPSAGLPPPGPLPPPTVHRTRSIDGHSRFVEPPMYEYTPTHSLYEGDTDEDQEYDEEEDDDEEYRLSTLRRTLRGINAGLHIVACILLLAIMALFLAHARRLHVWYHHTEPQAVTLIILLAADMGVDVMTLVRLVRGVADHRHPSSVVVAHLALGVSYLALFMVDVGIGAVFAQGYAFWGLTPQTAGPVVYVFLWMLGVWDLLHTALHRHQVGRSVRAGRAAVSRGWWWRWRRRGRGAPAAEAPSTARQAAPPPPAQAVAMQRRRPARSAPRPTLGLPPPVGSTPTTATAPPNALTPAVTTRGGGARSRPDDKPLSSSVSSASTTASMSTQTTRVERPGKEA